MMARAMCWGAFERHRREGVGPAGTPAFRADMLLGDAVWLTIALPPAQGRWRASIPRDAILIWLTIVLPPAQGRWRASIPRDAVWLTIVLPPAQGRWGASIPRD